MRIPEYRRKVPESRYLVAIAIGGKWTYVHGNDTARGARSPSLDNAQLGTVGSVFRTRGAFIAFGVYGAWTRRLKMRARCDGSCNVCGGADVEESDPGTRPDTSVSPRTR